MAEQLTSRTVYNPLPEDFVFNWDNVSYTIPAGGKLSAVHFVCVHGAKHLAKTILIRKGAFEDKMNGDKRSGRSVPQSRVEAIMSQLLDRNDDLDFDQIEISQNVKPEQEKSEQPKQVDGFETPLNEERLSEPTPEPTHEPGDSGQDSDDEKEDVDEEGNITQDEDEDKHENSSE